MKNHFIALTLLIPTAVLIGGSAIAGEAPDKKTIERGRYMTLVGACNDCHTDGYAKNGGNIPETDRLTGSTVGFSGPWGTSYPKNLRLVAQSVPEDKWLAHARTERRPPMPWFNLVAMNDSDLMSIYHYLRSLGAKGQAAPAAVPPGQAVTTPYIEFVPKNLPQQAAR